MIDLVIRSETLADVAAIANVTRAAFATLPISDGSEPAIIDSLRCDGALTLSLVAVDSGGDVVGHVACSPVEVSDGTTGWFGMGPLSVRPDVHGQGIGSALVNAALSRLNDLSAGGCVLLGDPAYYRRFGFTPLPGVELPGVNAGHFLGLVLRGDAPTGVVTYHPAFDTSPQAHP